MSELSQKIEKLPAWARQHIHHLETRSQPAIEEAAKARRELAHVRERNRNLQSANQALIEILQCAGKGGLDWTKTVVSILDSYEIFNSDTTAED